MTRHIGTGYVSTPSVSSTTTQITDGHSASTSRRTRQHLSFLYSSMASVLVPVAYVIIIFGGLFVFSFFYRKHTSSTSSIELSHFNRKSLIRKTRHSKSLRTIFSFTSGTQCIRYTPSTNKPTSPRCSPESGPHPTRHGRCTTCAANSRRQTGHAEPPPKGINRRRPLE